MVPLAASRDDPRLEPPDDVFSNAWRHAFQLVFHRPTVLAAAIPLLLCGAVLLGRDGSPPGRPVVLLWLATTLPITVGLAVWFVLHPRGSWREAMESVARRYPILAVAAAVEFVPDFFLDIGSSRSPLRPLLVILKVYLDVRLTFLVPAVVIEREGPATAVRRAWDVTRGRFGNVFLFRTSLVVAWLALCAATWWLVGSRGVLVAMSAGVVFIEIALTSAYLRLARPDLVPQIEARGTLATVA